MKTREIFKIEEEKKGNGEVNKRPVREEDTVRSTQRITETRK